MYAQAHADRYAEGVGTTIRVSESTRSHAAELARRNGVSIGEVVDRALTSYEAAEFWRATREALARHPDALATDAAWDRALPDGLDRD